MNTESGGWAAKAHFDRTHLWHPYASMQDPPPVYPVVAADGVRLTLADGRTVIDGMASWWAAIHGYNHPLLNAALTGQLDDFAHVMFGGLTHAAAIGLGRRLVALTPAGLDRIFFADSGSVAVEVALKMAVQYWQARGQPRKHRFLALAGGYHGDTLGAMSVSDPATGMHHLYADMVPRQIFAPRPACRFGNAWQPADARALELLLERRHEEIAAVILEPIVQGAGGMWFYHPEYVRAARALCARYDVLLIADEIATGFGRTGRLWACAHADVRPDILCIGKALTGGYMSLAATITTAAIATAIGQGGAGCLMHGPTFMANPLACAVASASLDILAESAWPERIAAMEEQLRVELAPCQTAAAVADVRALGAIGVVEMKGPVDLRRVTPQFIDAGVWLRPFGRLLYLMPPYVMTPDDLSRVTGAIVQVVRTL
ncbi:MAG: adenosylmethionine--8-amino-7-oxononanoate transaminase [Gammaproteobacteria bacterium]|nr:adenosylmethionine--8-amino-7-oxononanoate transaminase [Gammaproteobacteria bacterium]